MAFNYLQTDDRDDYLAQFSKKRTYKKYAVKHKNDKEWSNWSNKWFVVRIITNNTVFTKKDFKGQKDPLIIAELNKLGYKVYIKNLPYCTQYPKHTDGRD